ncbi:MAG TPA: formyltransferase family protein [Trueperaceae bacterium]
MNTLRVVLVAEEAAGVQTLRLLERSPHQVVAVMSGPTTGEVLRGASVGGLARTLGYRVWPARRVKDAALAEDLRAAGVDLLLNVHSLYLIHASVLAAPRLGAFNLHPGPLPEYAGMNAPSWAIYRGETRHGVSLHWMEAGIDTGAVAYRDDFEISEADTGLSVSAACVRRGLPLIERLLETAARDPEAVPRWEQDVSRRRYFGRDVPQGGRLDWRAPAREVVRFVRACDYYPLPSPWGTPQTCMAGAPLGVIQAKGSGAPAAGPPGTVGEVEEGGVRVAAADEAVLVRRVLWQGKARPAQEVLVPGMRLH